MFEDDGSFDRGRRTRWISCGRRRQPGLGLTGVSRRIEWGVLGGLRTDLGRVVGAEMVLLILVLGVAMAACRSLLIS